MKETAKASNSDQAQVSTQPAVKKLKGNFQTVAFCHGNQLPCTQINGYFMDLV